MEVVELGALTEREWSELMAGEEEPFGPDGARLAWREKEHNVGIRLDGRLVAVGGALLADVQIGTHSIEVVGIGGLIVTRSERGHGLMGELVPPLLRLAGAMGPEHAMIFCRPELLGLYRRLSFIEITAPVWADQPRGRVRIPLAAMWRALHGEPTWPPGRVDVRGLPF